MKKIKIIKSREEDAPSGEYLMTETREDFFKLCEGKEVANEEDFDEINDNEELVGFILIQWNDSGYMYGVHITQDKYEILD